MPFIITQDEKVIAYTTDIKEIDSTQITKNINRKLYIAKPINFRPKELNLKIICDNDASYEDSTTPPPVYLKDRGHIKDMFRIAFSSRTMAEAMDGSERHIEPEPDPIPVISMPTLESLKP